MDSKLPEDYESQITHFFKTPELRSEIRSYVRHRLFTSIQNSPLGPKLRRKDVQPVSPKLQTLNLLIAEYLLQHRHHFTLSVFSCEVPSVSCLSPSIQDTLAGRSCSSAIPFKQEDLQDMLHTLGVVPSSPEGKDLKMKYKSSQQPLLECLIRALPSLRVSVVQEHRDQACNTEQPKLTVENLAEEHEQAIALLQSVHAEQLKKLSEDLSSKLTAQIEVFEQEKKKFCVEQTQLKDSIANLQDHVTLAEQTLAAVRNENANEHLKLEEQRKKLESEIESTRQKLHLKQLNLSEEAHRLEKEKLGLKKVKKKLQIQQRTLDDLTITLAQSQAEVSEMPEKSLLPALEIQLQVKEEELSNLKVQVSSLREENTSLRNLTEQQRQRIDNLNIRMAEMVAELHATREYIVDAPRHSSLKHRESSDDSSPTDDIVRDARRRIKSLEEEFEAIGRYHRNFQVRQLNESLLSSVHGSSTGQLYVPQTNLSNIDHFLNYPHNSASIRLSQTHPPSMPKLQKPSSPRYRNAETRKQVHTSEDKQNTLVINDKQNNKQVQVNIVPTETVQELIVPQLNLSSDFNLSLDLDQPIGAAHQLQETRRSRFNLSYTPTKSDKPKLNSQTITLGNDIPELSLADLSMNNVTPPINTEAKLASDLTYVVEKTLDSDDSSDVKLKTPDSNVASDFKSALVNNSETQIKTPELNTTDVASPLAVSNSEVISEIDVTSNIQVPESQTFYTQEAATTGTASNNLQDNENSPLKSNIPSIIPRGIKPDTSHETIIKQVTILPSKMIEDSASSTSSSKHISAGVSGKDDVDFWDL